MQPIQVLLVEDSPADVLMVREALRRSRFHLELHDVQDGMAAMQFLRRAGSFEGAARPDLILLDLNLPRKDGREVLAEIKTDPDLKTIPVVILTSSKAEEDVRRCYNLHANCYTTKPVDFLNFERVLQGIGQFWFAVAKLPGR